MTQKTVKVYFEWYHDDDYAFKVGEEVMLVRKYYEKYGSEEWFLIRGCKDGIGGNLSPDIKRYHGWRGTTNGVSTDAYGLRKVIKASEIKVDKDGDRYQKVTVGKDLTANEE